MAKHVSDDKSISNVAMNGKDDSKNDDDTRLETQRGVSLPDGRTCDLKDLTLPERPRAPQIADTRTPPAAKPGYGAKKAGAKAVKKMEQESVEYKLSPEDATYFCALSARTNYLSQDRAKPKNFAESSRFRTATLKANSRGFAGTWQASAGWSTSTTGGAESKSIRLTKLCRHRRCRI